MSSHSYLLSNSRTLKEEDKKRPDWVLPVVMLWDKETFTRARSFSSLHDGTEAIVDRIVPVAQAEDARKQEISIDECMRLFTQKETLSERNLWYCSNCKEHVRATKEMHIWKLPRLLIIQFKRFRQEEHSSYRRKNTAFVDAPVE